MDQELRNKRVRRLVSKINKERKRQAIKVDILCNDLVAAQRDFLKTLDTISFTANFYESIVGTADLKNLLSVSAGLIKEEVGELNMCFFLRQEDNFESHLFKVNGDTNGAGGQGLEGYFTKELMENVCKSHKVCGLDDLLQMGLVGNPVVLKEISVVTAPLGQMGASAGFILFWRKLEEELTADELANICTVTRGLSRAIAACLVISHSAK